MNTTASMRTGSFGPPRVRDAVRKPIFDAAEQRLGLSRIQGVFSACGLARVRVDERLDKNRCTVSGHGGLNAH